MPLKAKPEKLEKAINMYLHGEKVQLGWQQS